MSVPRSADTPASSTKRGTSTIRESVAVLALLTAIPANRLAAAALAELFSRRRSLERCAEALVRWAREAS